MKSLVGDMSYQSESIQALMDSEPFTERVHTIPVIPTAEQEDLISIKGALRTEFPIQLHVRSMINP
jgi:hypothetical protein